MYECALRGTVLRTEQEGKPSCAAFGGYLPFWLLAKYGTAFIQVQLSHIIHIVSSSTDYQRKDSRFFCLSIKTGGTKNHDRYSKIEGGIRTRKEKRNAGEAQTNAFGKYPVLHGGKAEEK